MSVCTIAHTHKPVSEGSEPEPSRVAKTRERIVATVSCIPTRGRDIEPTAVYVFGEIRYMHSYGEHHPPSMATTNGRVALRHWIKALRYRVPSDRVLVECAGLTAQSRIATLMSYDDPTVWSAASTLYRVILPKLRLQRKCPMLTFADTTATKSG